MGEQELGSEIEEENILFVGWGHWKWKTNSSALSDLKGPITVAHTQSAVSPSIQETLEDTDEAVY